MNKNLILLGSILLIAFSSMLTTSCNNGENPQSKNENKSIMKETESGHITLINSFEVPTGKLEESIKYWEDCRDFLKTQPGYVSTKLHRSIKEDARFMLVNVAIWESPKAFMDATKKMQEVIGAPPVEGLKPNASLYTVVRE